MALKSRQFPEKLKCINFYRIGEKKALSACAYIFSVTKLYWMRNNQNPIKQSKDLNYFLTEPNCNC
jgi:hypothetical protein